VVEFVFVVRGSLELAAGYFVNFEPVVDFDHFVGFDHSGGLFGHLYRDFFFSFGRGHLLEQGRHVELGRVELELEPEGVGLEHVGWEHVERERVEQGHVEQGHVELERVEQVHVELGRVEHVEELHCRGVDHYFVDHLQSSFFDNHLVVDVYFEVVLLVEELGFGSCPIPFWFRLVGFVVEVEPLQFVVSCCFLVSTNSRRSMAF